MHSVPSSEEGSFLITANERLGPDIVLLTALVISVQGITRAGRPNNLSLALSSTCARRCRSISCVAWRQARE